MVCLKKLPGALSQTLISVDEITFKEIVEEGLTVVDTRS